MFPPVFYLIQAELKSEKLVEVSEELLLERELELARFLIKFSANNGCYKLFLISGPVISLANDYQASD